MVSALELPLFGTLLLMVVVALSGVLSFRVWSRRHATLAGRTTPVRSSARQRLGMAGIAVGALLAVVGVVVALSVTHRGELDVQGVWVARAEPERGVPSLVAGDTAAADDVLVRYRRPGADAERAEVEAAIERVAAERQRLLEDPLDVDGRLVRTAQLLGSERLLLLQRRETMAFDRHRLDQQGETELIAQRRELASQRAEIARLHGQRTGAAAQLQYAESLLDVSQQLSSSAITAGTTVLERQRDRDQAKAEVDRMDAEIVVQEGLAHELDAGITRLQDLVAATRTGTATALAQADRELDTVIARLHDVDAQETAQIDRLRARRVRELDLELAGHRARLQQLAERSTDRAAFAGHVVYRHPAPAAAPPGAVLLALAGGDSMQARFRVTAAEAREICARGEVCLELAGTDWVLEPRITGRSPRWRELPLEAGMAVVELDCQASWDALRAGLEGGRTAVRLVWLPPFWLEPLVRFGALLMIVGGLLLVWPRGMRAIEGWHQRWSDAA